ncbi:MAG: hypothetical protein E5X86_19860 [Mesorhizobium sp.]|uniref:hypothetical protein n=1 Tax=Mesorhizobium sp. TaxID=1871066 RepID=UPI001227C134|nr:hypothetical protein [Mesorhizobium sp.]TIO15627.1 MAG: hypothetical protein E5X86_19860 [Mesorhizobium sp.]
MMDDTDWTLVDFSEPKKAGAVNAAPASPLKACPKCGKPLKVRGRHFHVKWCKADDSARNA